jgi:hypothetical protein
VHAGESRRGKILPDQLQAFFKTAIVAHLKIPANTRSALVNGAQHGAAIQRHAPTVVQTAHHCAAPLIFAGQSSRHIVVTHQQDFQLTAASLAVGAGNFCAGRGFFQIYFYIHLIFLNGNAQLLSFISPEPPRLKQHPVEFSAFYRILTGPTRHRLERLEKPGIRQGGCQLSQLTESFG